MGGSIGIRRANVTEQIREVPCELVALGCMEHEVRVNRPRDVMAALLLKLPKVIVRFVARNDDRLKVAPCVVKEGAGELDVVFNGLETLLVRSVLDEALERHRMLSRRSALRRSNSIQSATDRRMTLSRR